MVVEISLDHLKEEEVEAILKVLERDARIQKHEDARRQKLRESVRNERIPEKRLSIKLRTGDWLSDVATPARKKDKRGADIVRASIRKKRWNKDGETDEKSGQLHPTKPDVVLEADKLNTDATKSPVRKPSIRKKNISKTSGKQVTFAEPGGSGPDASSKGPSSDGDGDNQYDSNVFSSSATFESYHNRLAADQTQSDRGLMYTTKGSTATKGLVIRRKGSSRRKITAKEDANEEVTDQDEEPVKSDDEVSKVDTTQDSKVQIETSITPVSVDIEENEHEGNALTSGVSLEFPHTADKPDKEQDDDEENEDKTKRKFWKLKRKGSSRRKDATKSSGDSNRGIAEAATNQETDNVDSKVSVTDTIKVEIGSAVTLVHIEEKQSESSSLSVTAGTDPSVAEDKAEVDRDEGSHTEKTKKKFWKIKRKGGSKNKASEKGQVDPAQDTRDSKVSTRDSGLTVSRNVTEETKHTERTETHIEVEKSIDNVVVASETTETHESLAGLNVPQDDKSFPEPDDKADLDKSGKKVRVIKRKGSSRRKMMSKLTDDSDRDSLFRAPEFETAHQVHAESTECATEEEPCKIEFEATESHPANSDNTSTHIDHSVNTKEASTDVITHAFAEVITEVGESNTEEKSSSLHDSNSPRKVEEHELPDTHEDSKTSPTNTPGESSLAVSGNYEEATLKPNAFVTSTPGHGGLELDCEDGGRTPTVDKSGTMDGMELLKEIEAALPGVTKESEDQDHGSCDDEGKPKKKTVKKIKVQKHKKRSSVEEEQARSLIDEVARSMADSPEKTGKKKVKKVIKKKAEGPDDSPGCMDEDREDGECGESPERGRRKVVKKVVKKIKEDFEDGDEDREDGKCEDSPEKGRKKVVKKVVKKIKVDFEDCDEDREDGKCEGSPEKGRKKVVKKVVKKMKVDLGDGHESPEHHEDCDPEDEKFRRSRREGRDRSPGCSDGEGEDGKSQEKGRRKVVKKVVKKIKVDVGDGHDSPGHHEDCDPEDDKFRRSRREGRDRSSGCSDGEGEDGKSREKGRVKVVKKVVKKIKVDIGDGHHSPGHHEDCDPEGDKFKRSRREGRDHSPGCEEEDEECGKSPEKGRRKVEKKVVKKIKVDGEDGHDSPGHHEDCDPEDEKFRRPGREGRDQSPGGCRDGEEEDGKCGESPEKLRKKVVKKVVRKRKTDGEEDCHESPDHDENCDPEDEKCGGSPEKGRKKVVKKVVKKITADGEEDCHDSPEHDENCEPESREGFRASRRKTVRKKGARRPPPPPEQ